MNLRMKYFVLKPKGTSVFARASRAAMRAYASVVVEESRELADQLLEWVAQESFSARNERALQEQRRLNSEEHAPKGTYENLYTILRARVESLIQLGWHIPAAKLREALEDLEPAHASKRTFGGGDVDQAADTERPLSGGGPVHTTTVQCEPPPKGQTWNPRVACGYPPLKGNMGPFEDG